MTGRQEGKDKLNAVLLFLLYPERTCSLRLPASAFVADNKGDSPELYSSKKIPLTTILASSIIIYLL
jgi:hypothetical protein